MDTTTTLYTKPDCVQCTATKRALDAAGVAYEEIDVSVDDVALEHVKALGFMAAPVVVAPSGDAWSGFRPDKLQRLEQDQAVSPC